MKENDHLTIYTIADAAGVSVSTVSRAFNHPEQVQPATLQKILEVCEECGYTKRPYRTDPSSAQPVPPADRRQKTLSSLSEFLLVVPTAKNSFYLDIIEGATSAAESHGCRLLTEFTELPNRDISSYMKNMERLPFSGYIFMTQLSASALAQLRSRFHIVQCSEYNTGYTDVSSVTIDDYQAQLQATQYMLSRGVRKPAYFTHARSFSFAEGRMQGFLDALRQRNIEVPERGIVTLPMANYSAAYDAAMQLLSEKDRPDAFVCGSDTFASACVMAAKDSGIAIPQDLKIIGFDDLPVCVETSPSISSVRQPSSQMGYAAFETLFRETTAGRPLPPQHIKLPTRLILREST